MSLETMTKLFSTTVGVGGTASITFSNIPQGYTDLCLKVSIRTNRTGAVDDVLQIQPNSSSSNLTTINVRGNGSGAASGNNTTWSGGYVACNGATSNTFGNLEVYFSNYSGFNYKYWSVDAVNENNATESYAELKSVLWSQSSPISSLTLVPLYGTSFNQHSTATLYGIKNAAKTAGNSIKATGGNIVFDGTYVSHIFTSSGTFIPTQPLTVDYLVVAGGGAGSLGGGGAGGFVTAANYSMAANASTSITIGAGGTAAAVNSRGGTGSNSVFAGVTAYGGGGGGGSESGSPDGGSGASGGGGGINSTNASDNRAGGSATPAGQGNAGGYGRYSGLQVAGGGGGGAGAAGDNVAPYPSGTATNAGNGGVGILSVLSGASTYYAGGGGGGGRSVVAGVGGTGGGGSGSVTIAGTAGTANTGGGGGGGSQPNGYAGAAGGSGIVIIRYKG